jgi:hypothetical protein
MEAVAASAFSLLLNASNARNEHSWAASTVGAASMRVQSQTSTM